eukprot:CAMPEP_0198546262 /NCGR_PEP_ID=MMETSP1462-20131121/66762_1 /TAXON_ID=1333877 /ORGANISM="Brandtodinium nutriculum, Strain RCC3387" /LENGTH=54 /DNA_ID=CAMNT_0044276693 /DNA_START=12 /DNA_END=173 /DNA_ORIENTATION=+
MALAERERRRAASPAACAFALRTVLLCASSTKRLTSSSRFPRTVSPDFRHAAWS